MIIFFASYLFFDFYFLRLLY